MAPIRRSDNSGFYGTPVGQRHGRTHDLEGAARGGAADVFGPGGGAAQSAPAVDVKALHAKIGELTLENDFLEGALSKAGLLNARR